MDDEVDDGCLESRFLRYSAVAGEAHADGEEEEE